ncbi:hypothetical protein LWC33_02275 [Pseudonocardia sp. RS11V-5]|uniref:hypothetical protein n=1 Tax=Pseudonocardia terrae TaxID=2905831 RepID=UPI001E553AA3|nr:hypothetical protein [Pseudonocardia terrae]MCE3550283.1 hypothetical protein [Pseudonocardia terrae]
MPAAPDRSTHPDAFTGPHPDLVRHLVRSTALDPGEAARVVDEVLDYFAEPTEDFVRRRHAELRTRGLRNDRIFTVIRDELDARRVAPPPLSARQLRRLVYG